VLEVWHIQRAVSQVVLAVNEIKTHIELLKSDKVLLVLIEHITMHSSKLISAQVQSL
jgi:hypothetical protein